MKRKERSDVYVCLCDGERVKTEEEREGKERV